MSSLEKLSLVMWKYIDWRLKKNYWWNNETKNTRLRCLVLLSNELSSNHGKRMQNPDCRKTFAFGIPKEIIHKNDEIDKQKI